jgi:uncharacterized protein YxjI
MKFNKFLPAIIIVAILGAVAFLGVHINAPENAESQYFCNQKLLSFDLNVDVEDMSGEHLYNINGEFFAAYEDDLAMTDVDGNVILRTDDQYNFITQNNHVICRDGDHVYHCDGEFKLFADSYEISDADGNKIAHVKFNMFDTVGIMVDNDGNENARDDSNIARFDYVVSIFNGCPIDEESVLMIFASYVSDVRADSD